MIDRDFKSNLKLARNKAGLTQSELATDSNMSQAYISEYENLDSNRLPTLQGACNLAMALDVSLDWLCGISDNYQLTTPFSWLWYLDKILSNPPKRNGRDMIQITESGDSASIVFSGQNMTAFFKEHSALRSVKDSIGADVYETALDKLIEKYESQFSPGYNEKTIGAKTVTTPKG